MSRLATITRETLRGKSLLRTLQNLGFAEITLSGTGIDLGSKSKAASYYRFVNIAPDTTITFSDLHSDDPDLLKIDLENEFPLAADSQDFVILNNVLEHLFNYQSCVEQIYRVLKPGGRLVGSVPYLVNIHPDPDDFFRYSASSLARIFGGAGFSEISVKPLGYGPFVAAASQIALLMPGVLRLGAYLPAVGIDRALQRAFPRKQTLTADTYPLGYFFVCTK